MNFDNGTIYPAIKNEDVKGFRVLRSAVDKSKFNVYAVDEFGVPLVPFFTEKEQEEALHLCQVLNTPYPEIKMVQFKTMEVDMPDGSTRFYQVEE